MIIKYLSLFLFTLLSLCVANATAQINPTGNADSEIVKERGMYSKVFLKENGDKEAIFSSSPVHYKKNGIWETINTKLTSNNSGYQNENNVIQSYFPKNVSSSNKIKLIVNSIDEIVIHSEKKLVIVDNQNNLNLIKENSTNATANVMDNTINYPNVYKEISDEFTILNGEIKNNVILSAPPTLLNNLSSGYFGFQEIVELPKGWKITTLDKAVNSLTSSPLFIFDAKGNHVLTIPAPIFFDNYGLESDGATTVEGKYLLHQENDSWSITTLVPVDWLKDVNTKYPVSIDPTVVLAGATGGWQSPNNFVDNPGFVFIGVCCGNLTHRAWIKFNTASIPDNSCITNVELEVNVATVVAATPELVHVNDVTGAFGPYGAINPAAYTDFGTGLYTSFTINGTGTYGYYGLGVTANALLQAQLPVDWFQVALMFDNEPSTNYKIINGTSSNLRVTYNGSCCPPPPAIAAITGPISVCEGSTATYTVPAQAGATAYNWTVPAGATITSGQNTTSLNVTWNTTPGGQICVDWTDACPATSLPTCLTVTVNPTPPAPTALGVTICPNNSATLTATAPGGTYEWYDLPIGGTLLITNASYTTPVLSSTTTYYVQTTVNGCVSPRTAVTVTISPLLVVDAGLDTAICFGDTYTLGVTPNGVGYSYVWDEPLNMGFSTVLNPTVSPTSTITYTITVTDPSNCIGSDNITITVNPIPLAPTALSVTICPNNSTTLTATAPGGTYEWFDAPVAGTLLITNASYTTPVLVVTTTYYVQTTINGCVSPRTAVTVTISPLLVVDAGLDTAICFGDTYTLGVTPNGVGYSYVWDEPLNMGFSTVLNPTVSPTSTTTYTVTVTDPSNCIGSDNITITVNPIPLAPTALSVTICPNNSTTLTATAPGGTYEWFDAPVAGTLLITGASYTTPILVANTTYYVQTTINGCVSPRTAVTVTISPLLVVNAGLDATICLGNSYLLSVLPNGAGYSYVWDEPLNMGFSAIFNPTVNPTSTTTYTVTVTDPNNCVGSDNITITVNPGASTNAISNIQSCPGDIIPASAFVSVPAGGTFAWTNSNTSIGLAASGTSNTPSFTAINSSGSPVIATVSVIATANGCTGTPTNYTITVNPVVTSSTNVSICQGDSMLINGVYHASAGNYLDTLLSSFGCDSIITYNLTINMVSVANSNVIVCQGDSVLINGNYYSSAGSYPFTFTSSFGCDSVIIYSVSIAPLPSFNITGGASINIGESSNLAVLPGVFGTTYSWDPPVGLSCFFCQNPIATPMESTWYYVTVTSAAGCQTMDSVYIEVDPSTNIYIPNIFSPNNDDNNDMYLVRGKGVDQFNLAIYNRWGQLVFESNDIENGWDGTKDGTPLNQGVFVYKLQVIMYNNDRIEQTGNITLIR